MPPSPGACPHFRSDALICWCCALLPLEATGDAVLVVMDVRRLILCLAVCASWAAGKEGPSWKPDCTGKAAHERIGDPTNCRQYYICMWDAKPTDHVLTCPSDQKFDPAHGGCVHDDGYRPSYSRNATAAAISTTAATTCHYACGGENDLLTDPFDCSAYHLCVANQKHGPFFCPSDRPYFNGRYCVESDGNCCRETCVPYCLEGNVQIPDPLDCRRFYICLEKGLASVELHFDCKKGMVMDEVKGRCVARDHCDPACTDQAAERFEEIANDLDKITDYKEPTGRQPSFVDVAKKVEAARYKASVRHWMRG